MRRRWSLGHTGPHYEALSSASLCAVAALSEDWERPTPTPGEHTKVPPSMCFDGLYLHYEVEALLRGGDETRSRSGARFADRPRTNGRERIAYLRSMAVLSEFEGDTQRALDHAGAEALAEKIGLPRNSGRSRAKSASFTSSAGRPKKPGRRSL